MALLQSGVLQTSKRNKHDSKREIEGEVVKVKISAAKVSGRLVSKPSYVILHPSYLSPSLQPTSNLKSVSLNKHKISTPEQIA